jgi:hypothetical protein
MAHSKPTLILTILLLNVACPTARSPVVRVHKVSVDPDGNLQDETKPAPISALASMFPDQPEAKGLISSLLMLAEMKPSDELITLIKDLKLKIVPWHTNATATLKTAIEAINACAASMEGAKGQTEAKKGACTAQSTSHTTHRMEEETTFTAKEHWKAATAEKKEVMVTECKIFSDVKDEAKSATASYAGGDEGAYLESVQQEFCAGLLPRYKEAKEKCTTAETDHVGVSGTYETATTAHTVQKTASDTVQTEMDVACCEYALSTKAACKSYDTCYDDEVAEYNSLKAIIESEEKVKKTEWRVYSRIECLLPVLGTDDAAKIEECRAKDHSTTHLDIEYPAIPDESTCNMEEAYPGTEAYYNSHFGTLPENAKGQDAAQCTGMMEAGAATHEVVAQSARATDEQTCKAQCAAAGYCCNEDVRKGSNQYLSCLQACVLTTQNQDAPCETRSCDIAGNGWTQCSSCSCSENGGTCSGKCSWGVQDHKACFHGKTLAQR